MRAVRPLLGLVLSAVLVTAGGLFALPSDASTLPPPPPPRPCGEKACDHSWFKEWFDFSIPRTRWSVAAVQGRVNSADLTLWNGSYVSLGQAHDPSGTTWIASDNTPGHQPTGPHHVSVDIAQADDAPWEHWVQYINGHGDLLQQRSSVIGDASGRWLVDIRDVRLTAGDMLGLTIHGGEIGTISVLSSDPSRPASWIQTRGSALATYDVPKANDPTDRHDYVFTAPATGTYGLLFEPQGWWSRSSTVDAAIVG